MGNTPSRKTNPTKQIIYKTKYDTMYNITDECKKVIEDNIELEESIRDLTIRLNNSVKESTKFELENFKLKNQLSSLEKDLNLYKDRNKNSIQKINKQKKVKDNKIKSLNNEILNRDNQIKDLNNKLLKNDCSRNYKLAERIKEINNDLKECNILKNKITKENEKNLKTVRICNQNQERINIDKENCNRERNILSDENYEFQMRVGNTDKFLSKWRITSIVFILLFIIFLLMYIFKKGNCYVVEKKIKNINLKEKYIY